VVRQCFFIPAHLSQSRQSRPRDRGEVMVLVVVSHVERQRVQRSIVRRGFNLVGKNVVLGNEMTGNGVKASRKVGAHEQIQNGSPAKKVHRGFNERKLHNPVEQVPLCKRLRANKQWAKRVMPGLIAQKKELAWQRIEQASFQFRGQIRVHSLNALVFVMVVVVKLERHEEGKHEWNIRKNAKQLVVVELSER